MGLDFAPRLPALRSPHPRGHVKTRRDRWGCNKTGLESIIAEAGGRAGEEHVTQLRLLLYRFRFSILERGR